MGPATRRIPPRASSRHPARTCCWYRTDCSRSSGCGKPGGAVSPNGWNGWPAPAPARRSQRYPRLVTRFRPTLFHRAKALGNGILVSPQRLGISHPRTARLRRTSPQNIAHPRVDMPPRPEHPQCGVRGRDDSRTTLEMATVTVMAGIIFDSRPARALKADVTVMLKRTRDELPAIQQLWPRFEDLVGLRGRRM